MASAKWGPCHRGFLTDRLWKERKGITGQEQGCVRDFPKGHVFQLCYWHTARCHRPQAPAESPTVTE